MSEVVKQKKKPGRKPLNLTERECYDCKTTFPMDNYYKGRKSCKGCVKKSNRDKYVPRIKKSRDKCRKCDVNLTPDNHFNKCLVCKSCQKKKYYDAKRAKVGGRRIKNVNIEDFYKDVDEGIAKKDLAIKYKISYSCVQQWIKKRPPTE